MRIILSSDNLIGDLLMQTPAIRCLKKTHPEDEVHYWVPIKDKGQHVAGTHVMLEGNPYLSGLYVGDQFVQQEGDGIIQMQAMPAYLWAVKSGKTISQGFGHICGVEISDNDLTYDYYLTEEEIEEGKKLADTLGKGRPCVAIARHSASCSSNDPKIGWPNKCLPNYIWVEVAQWLAREGYVPVALGSDREVKDIRYRHWPGEKLYGKPIRSVAGFLKACPAVLSVDTGIRHLAAAVGTNMYCLSGTIPLKQIRCVPIHPEHKIFEEYCPLQDANAKKVIESARKVLP